MDDSAQSPSPRVLERVDARLGRLSMRADALRLRLPGGGLTKRMAAASADTGDWTFLRRPAVLGFVAVLSICLGASLPSSPFKLEMGGTWFFGEATWPTTTWMLAGVGRRRRHPLGQAAAGQAQAQRVGAHGEAAQARVDPIEDSR